jgi:hypothetical protein
MAPRVAAVAAADSIITEAAVANTMVIIMAVAAAIAAMAIAITTVSAGGALLPAVEAEINPPHPQPLFQHRAANQHRDQVLATATAKVTVTAVAAAAVAAVAAVAKAMVKGAAPCTLRSLTVSMAFR